MLILAFAVEESAEIWLEDGRVIRLKVVENRGDRVRIGFDAVREIQIHRQPIADAIRGEVRRKAGVPAKESRCSTV